LAVNAAIVLPLLLIIGSKRILVLAIN
jgi:hypothetical protein